MSMERMRFQEPGMPQTEFAGGKSTGCYLSSVSAGLLALLAVVLAIGVGVVVYFAASAATIQCQCLLSSDNGPQVSDLVATPAPDHLWPTCINMSIARNECLSSPSCPGMDALKPPPTTPKPLARDVRLPTALEPLHYNVELKSNMYGDIPEEFTFEGKVAVWMECKEATNMVVLHINKLTIDNDTLILRHAEYRAAPGWTHWEEDKERQFFKLYLDGHLEVGQTYVLSMSFVGPLEDTLAGFYRSSYEERNQTRWLSTTQFQPTDARRAFPCFDEPAIKATFNTTLLRQPHMHTLSNMPLVKTEHRPDGWFSDHFQTTVKMSTYLLAFIVCDFEFRERTTANGVRFRVWARREAIHQADFALEIGVSILDYFESYFGIGFPLPKQDMIAIPDFSAGAMENWGLITYRETTLLYDPHESSLANQQHVAIVVSHEIAHQWFGNLVTPNWWDDLWLNEGFATYIEYIGVDRVRPDFMMSDQFLTQELQSVLGTDGLGTSHPIYIPVYNPEEINEIFDKISYSKGASVIRMMNYFLGEDTFRQGLKNYLNAKQYSDATHTDLWMHLQEQAETDGQDIDVMATMNTWIKQMGYPVVTIRRSSSRRDTAQVSQVHFLLEPTQKPNAKYDTEYNYKWVVPLTYTTSTEKNWENPIRVWMNMGDVSLSGIPPTAEWIIANIEQQGFFRVNYDEDNWNSLIRQLKDDHTQIPVRNRAQIVDDAFALGSSGLIDQLVGLQVTEYLIAEEEYLPWSAASDHLSYISNMLQASEAFGLYQKYILGQIKPTYERLGWDSRPTDTHLEKYLRLIAIAYACEYGYKPCMDRAARMYTSWMLDPERNSIHPDLRSTVYCNGVRAGGQDEWNFSFNRYKTVNLAAEKSKLLYAMSCTAEPWLLSRYLGKVFDQSEIRKQDVRTVISYVSRNPIGRYFAWDFVRAHWEEISKLIDGGFYDMGSLVLALTASFNTEFEMNQVRAVVQERATGGTGLRSFLQALEKIQANVRWRNDNEAKVSKWLQKLLRTEL